MGYKYHLGMHMVLCHGPVDQITAITVDKRQAWSGSATGSSSIRIDAPSLFGGEKREGGVSGTVDFAFGEQSQTANSYLASRLPGPVPSFRGVVSAILRRPYLGNNPYLKPWAFRAQRIHKSKQDGRIQWYDQKAEIGKGTMNPAHIIRECLTDTEWGMGYNESDLDGNSFVKAADKLHEEEFGLCLLWSRQTTIQKFIQNVLAHIDGALYVDRSTGKFVLRMIREDYDIDKIPTLDESNIIAIKDFARPTVGELTNAVTVQYWNIETGQNDSLSVQDIALAQQQGSVISTTKQYPGIASGELAAKVAARDLQGVSVPLIGCTLTTTRQAANLNIGDTFKLKWPKYGVDEVVMRVIKLGFGVPNNNQIKIECVQDVFASAKAVYSPPPVSEWQPPVSKPAPVIDSVLREAPYWELAQRLGDKQAAQLEEDEAYVLGTGIRPSGDAIKAGLHLGAASATQVEEAGVTDFCPGAVLAQDIDYLTSAFAIDDPVDIDLIPEGSHIEMDDELMRVDRVTDTAIHVTRGVLDTLPSAHKAGARILAWDVFAESDENPYLAGETVHMKLTTVTGQGELPLSSAISVSRELVGRAFRPYPPGNIRINSQHYPSVINGRLSISWAHRDRLQQTVKLVGFNEGSIGPESGTEYELQILDENKRQLLFRNDLTGTSFSYTTEQSDLNKAVSPPSGLYQLSPNQAAAQQQRSSTKLTIYLKSRRQGLQSLQEYSLTVERSGYGYNYGNYYGGH
ncbi:MAG: phage tail protein [Endozoicomonas sp.]